MGDLRPELIFIHQSSYFTQIKNAVLVVPHN